MQMTFGSLFAGIGGFDLGLERAGMKCLWQCERDKFCNKVLAKHWPEVTRYDDITTLDAATLAPVDLICGGFPCQPFSLAGKRKGAEDDRFLWPAMLKVIETVRPTWVLGENVVGIIQSGLDRALFDLETCGYTGRAFVVPACGVGAPHLRERVWIVAHSNEMGKQICHKQKSGGPLSRDRVDNVECPRWETEPELLRVDDGIPEELDACRIGALGNAVVPQVVEVFGRMIIEAHQFGGTT